MSNYFQQIGATATGGGVYLIYRNGDSGAGASRIVVTENGGLDKPDWVPDPSKKQAEWIKKNSQRLLSIIAPVSCPVGVKLPPLPEGAREYVYEDEARRALLVVHRLEAGTEWNGTVLKEKKCLPHIYDGVTWQQAGWPSGLPAPLYGDWRGRSKVMVHEGEKAVDAALDAVASKRRREESALNGVPDEELPPVHPWADWLSEYGHCTWPGGTACAASGPWLQFGRDVEVFLMPDNDRAGYEAMHAVSRELVNASLVLMYHHMGNGAPRGWDMADPCFEHSLDKLMLSVKLAQPAMKQVLLDNGETDWVLNREFVSQFFEVDSNKLVYRGDPRMKLTTAQFDNAYRSKFPPHKKVPSQEMFKSEHLMSISRVGYRPFMVDHAEEKGVRRVGAGWIFEDSLGDKVLNKYRPGPLRAREPRKGHWRHAASPFLVFMRHLIPDRRERHELIRWCCAVIACHRMRWSPLLISEVHGTGKTTLADTLTLLLGQRNCTWLSGHALTEQYSHWADGSQLIIVSEMKDEGGFKVANRLKQYITEDRVSVREMYEGERTVDAETCFLFNSNFFSSISVVKGDRRWFIPHVTSSRTPHAGGGNPLLEMLADRWLKLPKSEADKSFFGAYRQWLNGGGAEHLLWLGRWYGREMLKPEGWARLCQDAPLTTIKEEMMESQVSPWEQLLADHISGEEDMLVGGDLRSFCEDRGVRYVPKPAEVTRFLEGMGFDVCSRDIESARKNVRRGDRKMHHGGHYLGQSIVYKRRNSVVVVDDMPAKWSDWARCSTLLSSRFLTARASG
jgi:hypothetical protein